MEKAQHGTINLQITDTFNDLDVKSKEDALKYIEENSTEFGDEVSILEDGNNISIIIYGNNEETYNVLLSRFKHQPFLKNISSRFDNEID